jgi:uncharacterized protein YegJ (DUF2314 family)
MSPSEIARALAAAGMAVALLCSCGGAKANDEPLTPAQAKEAAAEQAQTHLSFFLERLTAKDPADQDFRLTIRLPPEGRSRPRAELGVRDIVRQGSSLQGVVTKPDKSWPEFELGETMTFPASIIIDWSFTRHGTLIGLFQLRAQICTASQTVSELPKEMHDQVRAETGKTGELLLNPKEACKPTDPRKDFEKIKARK